MSRDIFINLIDRDEAQPRQHFDQAALDELAQSIAANGLAVPILVRPVGKRFVIVHGERRYRAVQSLKWETIPADVRNVSEDEAHWLALVENVQRSDLSPIEEARAYQARLAEGITQEALGQRIGKSQSHIATKLRFLQLPRWCRWALQAGDITEGHAKQLLRLRADGTRDALAMIIQACHLSVHATAVIIDRVLPESAEDAPYQASYIYHFILSDAQRAEVEAWKEERQAKGCAYLVGLGCLLSVSLEKEPDGFEAWIARAFKMDMATAQAYMQFEGATVAEIPQLIWQHLETTCEDK